MFDMDKKTTTIWAFIVIVGLVIAAVILWQTWPEGEAEETELTPPSGTDLPAEVPGEEEAEDSLDWQVYKDSERGFQFSYPTGLVANRNQTGDVITFIEGEITDSESEAGATAMQVSLLEKDSDLSLREFVEQQITPSEEGGNTPVYSESGPLSQQENLYVVRKPEGNTEYHYYFAFPESDRVLDFMTTQEKFAAEDLVAVVSSLLFRTGHRS